MSVEVLNSLSGPVILVGAGKMGGAILDGWLRGSIAPTQVVALDPNIREDLASDLLAQGVVVNPSLDGLPTPAVLVLAVKPQAAPAVLATVRRLVAPGTLVVSIMAGRTLDFLRENLPRGAAIVRTIPNTPASIGQGITVAVPNAQVSPERRAVVDALLAALGPLEWVDDEDLIDAATAVSGSGPAYVFLLAETLAKAGVAVGLPADLADRLARATVAGAGALIAQSGIAPASLRENVTSPAGTTAAALEVLMDPARGFAPLMEEAVVAATRRSRALG